MSALIGAQCGTHAGLPAVEICVRCGRFLCGDCVQYVLDEQPACATCAPVLRGTPASLRAKVSPLLTTIGWVAVTAGIFLPGRRGIALWLLGTVCGMAGLALAVQELRLIRAGQAGTLGRRWARLGLVVGLLFAVTLGGLIGTFTWWFVRHHT